MRLLFAALALLFMPGLALAQRSAAPAAASPGLPPIGLPLAPIGLPLPPIGLPLPSIGLPPRTVDHGRESAPRHQRSAALRGADKTRFHPRPTIIYFGAPYFAEYEPPAQAPAPGLVASQPDPEPAPPATGRIRLELRPAEDPQLYVDGVFFGTLAEAGAELELRPGVRSVEIRAPGYEPLTFDANIVEGKVITYRGTLTPVAAAGPGDPSLERPDAVARETKPEAPSRRQTFYLIPGCYMGNVPPQEVRLPPGCDVSRLITYRP
jgi:hypothetical protein